MDFSVIIPMYNCQDSIEKTVESIEAVQYNSMEIILVDDGSTDYTHDKCKIIAAHYSNVRYYYQNNSGVSAARNYGVQQSAGKYVLFWDSDDLADPKLLRKCLLKAIEVDVDILIFGMIFRYFYHDSIKKEEHLQCKSEILINTNAFADNLDYLFDINYLSSACNKILKRSLCQKVCFNTSKKVFEDLLYVLEYIQYCKTVYIVPELAYIYHLDVSLKKTSRAKCVDDFNEYMFDFQNAVIKIEMTLNTKLFELRNRISLVYEWILSSKLEASSFSELKELNTNKMAVFLFGEKYIVKSKKNKLFFDHRFAELKLLCIYHTIRKRLELW